MKCRSSDNFWMNISVQVIFYLLKDSYVITCIDGEFISLFSIPFFKLKSETVFFTENTRHLFLTCY